MRLTPGDTSLNELGGHGVTLGDVRCRDSGLQIDDGASGVWSLGPKVKS
jgi:hypothetical protein